MGTGPKETVIRKRLNTPLKLALREEGRRQDWLAEQIGASADQVCRWANGVHIPVEATRELIAARVGRKVDELWPDEQVEEQAAA